MTEILPGTNQIIRHRYMQKIVNLFEPVADGRYVCCNHYIDVTGDDIHVQAHQAMAKINGHYTPIVEPAFDYKWLH